MALATSLAAAISWSPRRARAALAVLALLSLAAPALAAEQVYVWRDQNGSVQFSPVPDTDRPGECRRVESTIDCERTAEPAALVTNTAEHSAY